MSLAIPKIISQRINLTMPLEKLVNQVVKNYFLGKIIKLERFKIGYEELNLKLTTNKGIFVIKIFSKTRNLEKLNDYLKGWQEFAKNDIPVAKLLKSSQGYLFGQQNNYLCVSRFFDGQSFTQTKAGKQDFAKITDYLARIHQLKFKILPNYDPWGTANFLSEFKLKKKYLTFKDLNNISKIADDFSQIDFKKLTKSIIHGDLQKQHVLKNKFNKYCILDLGCMDYNASVIDLSIFLAQFCFDQNKKLTENLHVFDFCRKQYLKINQLNPYELSLVPILVKATFGLYIIQCSFLLNSGKDQSRQTKNWLQEDRQALEILKNYC